MGSQGSIRFSTVGKVLQRFGHGSKGEVQNTSHWTLEHWTWGSKVKGAEGSKVYEEIHKMFFKQFNPGYSEQHFKPLKKSLFVVS